MFTNVAYHIDTDSKGMVVNQSRTFNLNGSELYRQVTDAEGGSTLTNSYGETLASGTHDEVSAMWDKVIWPIVDAT